MRNELLERLVYLQMLEKSLLRNLDLKCYNEKKRTKIFNELQEVKNEIKKVKFKLRLQREMKNEKSREGV